MQLSKERMRYDMIKTLSSALRVRVFLKKRAATTAARPARLTRENVRNNKPTTASRLTWSRWRLLRMRPYFAPALPFAAALGGCCLLAQDARGVSGERQASVCRRVRGGQGGERNSVIETLGMCI